MYEEIPQEFPETYFTVNVANLAEFVICAVDADFANLRLREYCKNNPVLNLDPDSHFDIFNLTQPLTDGSEAIYKKTQLGHGLVRLMSYKEPSSYKTEPVMVKKSTRHDPIQQQIFSV